MTDSLTILNWDTGFLGKLVGSLSVSLQSQLEDGLLLAQKEGCEIVYVYSSFPILPNRFGDYLLIDVGGEVKFSKSLHADTDFCKPEPCMIRYQDKPVFSNVLELAYISGHFSRFRIDPYLPNGSFEKLYEIWLQNSINNFPLTNVFLCHSGPSVFGMVTAEQLDASCSIGLLAVSPTHQGQGFGTRLIQEVERNCLRNNVFTLSVKTQCSNKRAQSLYLKNSFEELHRSYLYHAHMISYA